jgi:cysteine synthase B
MKLIELIGNTPLVEIQHLNTHPNVKIYGKLEGNNPGGSVKDRAAYGMIMNALERGDIKPGDRLIEATSGNTGIALAMIAQLTGVHMTLLMPANSTKERVLTMEAYGAKVILTDASKGIPGNWQTNWWRKKVTLCSISLPILITMACITVPPVLKFLKIHRVR